MPGRPFRRTHLPVDFHSPDMRPLGHNLGLGPSFRISPSGALDAPLAEPSPVFVIGLTRLQAALQRLYMETPTQRIAIVQSIPHSQACFDEKEFDVSPFR